MTKKNYLRPTSLDMTSTKAFWEGMKQRKLLTTKCRTCDHLFFPPRSHCPKCLGTDLEWVELSGRGTLHSWTEVHIPSPDFDTPFLIGLIDLAEGIGRMASKLVGVKADQLRMDMPVKIVYADMEEGFTLYQFTVDG